MPSLGAYIVGPTTTTQLQRLSVAFALQLRSGPTCRDVICTQDVRKVNLTISFIALFAVFESDKSFINLEPSFPGKKRLFCGVLQLVLHAAIFTVDYL